MILKVMEDIILDKNSRLSHLGLYDRHWRRTSPLGFLFLDRKNAANMDGIKGLLLFLMMNSREMLVCLYACRMNIDKKKMYSYYCLRR